MRPLFRVLVLSLSLLVPVAATAQTCLDPGDILVAQPDGSGAYGAVRRIDPVTGADTLVAGGSSSANGWFDNVWDLAMEPGGTIVTSGSAPIPHVSRVNPAAFQGLEQISWGFEFGSPEAVAVERDGSILVVDSYWNNSPDIMRVDPAGGSGGLAGPYEVVVSFPQGDLDIARRAALEADGSLLVANFDGRKVFRLDLATGIPTLLWQSGPSPDQRVQDLVVDTDGSIFALMGGSGRGIYRIDPVTGAASVVSSFNYTGRGLALEPDGNLLFTVAFGSGSGVTTNVFRVDRTTGVVSDLALLDDAPYGIIVVGAECSDGFDNDGDGDVDFPDDADCADGSGTSERAPSVGAPARGNLLANGGFETPEAIASPTPYPGQAGDWVGVGQVTGMVTPGAPGQEEVWPAGGSGMLEIGQPTSLICCGELEEWGAIYEVHQIVDLTGLAAAVDAGRLRLAAGLLANVGRAVSNGPPYPTYDFYFRFGAYRGFPDALAEGPSPSACPLASEQTLRAEVPDGFPRTWLPVQGEFLVPPGTDFLLLTIGAVGDKQAPDTSPVIFPEYVDSVSLRAVECDDGVDNDGDGLIDLADGGCQDADDLVEGAIDDPACGNGIDDDGDGLVDFPLDLGCRTETTANESPGCQDGTNNDIGQDPDPGLVDFDGGQWLHGVCTGTVCPPGVSDPDGDGVADPDPQCVGRASAGERRGCGLGGELALLLALLPWWRPRRRPDHH
jgi:hypothetical protein